MKEIIDSRYLSLYRFAIEKGRLTKHSLFFITSGEITYRIERQSGKATAGMLLSFPGYIDFERRVTEHAEFYYFRYKSPEEQPLPVGAIPIENTGRMKATCDMILRLEKLQQKALQSAFLNDLFAQVEAEKLLTLPKEDALVQRVRGFLEAHLGEKLSLAHLAEEMRLSPSGLIHRFKSKTGQTPMAYLTEMRVSKAQVLLGSTDLPVFEIASLCGFENAYYFSNVFKANTGISPRDYRKKQII